MKKYLTALFVLSVSSMALASANETVAKAGSAPAHGATPVDLCKSPEAESETICKNPVKLAFRWSNDGQLATNSSIITLLSQKATVASTNGADQYKIEVTPQYAKLDSKTGLFMRLKLFRNENLVATPEIFSTLGEQASIRIRHSPDFVGFESLEFSAVAETIK